MLIQLNYLLQVSKVLNEENSAIELPEIHTKGTRNNKIFRMMKTRREKAPSEFTLKLSEMQIELNLNLSN